MHKLIFKKLLTHIKQHNFLPASDHVTNRWAGTDVENRYLDNLKTQPSDWYYRTNSVKYTVNSKGYRTREFKKINWSDSVVLFGCSNVFGVGLDDKDTLASQLENIIDRPVINLGQGGTSINYNLHNSVILANGYPSPKAVVMAWPSYSRCVYYKDKDVVNYGPWNLEKNNFMDLWNTEDSNAKINAYMSQTIFRQIWKDRTTIFECSFNYDSSKLLNCQAYRKDNPTLNDPLAFYDSARDLMHPGIETVKRAAKDIANNICIN